MAIIDVVKFDGLKNRDWLVYKHFSEKLVMGTQLIVGEGQVAIFVHNGQIADVFYPGKYTLSTENIPILKSLVNLPFGGKTPFPAEVYYINTKTKLDINWGTTDPIQLIDPKYFVKLRIRAFGQMALKMTDPVTFFREIVGQLNSSDLVRYDKVKDYYRGMLVLKAKSTIADVILNQKISALEISGRLEEISSTVRDKIEPFFEEYGMKIVNFFVQSINFPDEDFEKINQILQDKAAFEIMGDRRYATKRGFDVYEGAANNQSGVAGAFVGAGMGVGAGMNMQALMNQSVGNPIQASADAAPQQTDRQFCPHCGMANPRFSKFCNNCGSSLSPKVCECGAEIPAGAKFCNNCGRKID